MPFIANTPESLLPRSDSKNPTRTCRGITASGRPCRRAIATPSLSSRRPLTPVDPRDESLYCWQHREQASYSAHSSPGPRATATPILEEGRTSLDTLADRLGLVDLGGKGRKKRREGPPRPKPKPKPKPSPEKLPRKTKKRTATLCFCFSIPLDDPSPPPRPQPRPVQKPARPSAPIPKPLSHTARLKTLIPNALPMATASALMAELSRGFVESEEAGYIYMFWLLPTQRSRTEVVPVQAARSLLVPPATERSGRRPSDVVSRFAGSGGTMLLKIGRAANVQRRMNQWQRQCGYEVEMLRYYPYVSTSSSSSVGDPRPTRHAHKVERLIHIELAGMGLKASKEACGTCGREHREWFEVEASRAAVGRVDDVMKRWVEWDEG